MPHYVDIPKVMTSSRSGIKMNTYINIQETEKDTEKWRQSRTKLSLLSSLLNFFMCRSQWQRDLRRRSAAARLLRLWVRIPSGAWMSVVNVVCCQVEFPVWSWSLVQRSSTEFWCVVVCGLESSWEKRPRSTGNCCAPTSSQKKIT